MHDAIWTAYMWSRHFDWDLRDVLIRAAHARGNTFHCHDIPKRRVM